MPWITGIIMASLNGSVASGVLIASGIYLIGLVVLPFARETKGLPLPTE
jgi:hypothetical protein